MAKNCSKCSDAINGIEFVVCRGYCGASFHMNTCSGVTRALLSYFSSNKKNLFWMCDKCAELFENSHLRSISSTADQLSPLNSLTTAITELRAEIKQIHSKSHPQSSPAVNWPPLSQRRAIKRPLEVNAIEKCNIGSKQPLGDVVSVPICKNEDQKFWLYLSRIRPDVTIEAVSAMAKANLNLDGDPSVVKLVPKDKNINTLSFVSFKVGLDPVLKSAALNPETWPEGILFREFEDNRSLNFRVPQKLRKQSTPFLSAPALSPTIPVLDLTSTRDAQA